MLRRIAHSLGMALLCACLLPALATICAAQNESGSIVGQVSVARAGLLNQRIKVTLETRGAIVSEAWTDNEGRYAFLQLTPNIYHVMVNDERYQPYRENVAVNPIFTRTNVLNLVLVPRSAAKPDAPQPQVAGGNPYVIDKSYEKQFPKKVLKQFKAGVKEQEKGKLENAIKHFQEAIALAPDFYPAHNNLGSAYVAQAKFPEAQQAFQAVLRLNQGDTQAYFNLGNVYLLTSQFDEAKRVLEDGIRLQPQVSLGHFLLGTVLARSNQREAAERELRKAQELDPLDPQVAPRTHLELVNLYLQQQKTVEAIAELKVFLTKFPEDAMAPRVRQVLARLEGGAAPKE